MDRCSFTQRMGRIAAMLLIATVLALSIGCADAVQALPPPSEALPAEQSAGTGLPEVDALLDAVLRQDGAALVAMVGYSEVECLAEQPELVDYTAPPTCAQTGVPSGTLLRFLPYSRCHGEWLGEASVRSGLVGIGLGDGRALYGVYRYTPDDYPYRDDPRVPGPTPDYAVFIEDTRERANFDFPLGNVVYLSAGKIVRVSLFGACGPPTPDGAAPGWIIPPR